MQMKLRNKNFQFHVIGNGPPLVLISGLGASRIMWDTLIQKIKKHFQIVYFDNPGIGENNLLTAPTNTDAMAVDVIKIIEHLNLKNPCVIGHSLGSYVAQRIAAKSPNLVKNLILVSTRLKTSINSILHYNVILNLIKAGVSRETLIEDSLSWLYGVSYLKNTTHAKKLIQDRLAPPLSSFENFSNQVAAAMQHDSSKIAQKITSRTIIINGEEDIVCTPKEAGLLAEKIKSSELLILKNLGHMIPIENPSYFSALIKNILLCENN